MANRLGPEYSPNQQMIRDGVNGTILAAAGLNPALLGRSDGTLLREAYRQFVTSTIQPTARAILPELRLKLDAPDLELDFTALRSADVTGRARAFAGMVGAGLAPEVALELAGLIDS